MCRPRTAHTLHYPNTKAITEAHAHLVLYCIITPCVPCLCSMFRSVPHVCNHNKLPSITRTAKNRFYQIPDPQQGALVQAVTFGGKEGEGGTGAVGDRLFLKHDLFADKLLLATTSVMFWKPAVEAFALWSADCETVYPSGKTRGLKFKTLPLVFY